MMNSSVDVLSSQLKPLCSRDNHVMKYESGRSRANTGNQASYHCGSGGCSVRYNSIEGFTMTSMTVQPHEASHCKTASVGCRTSRAAAIN